MRIKRAKDHTRHLMNRLKDEFIKEFIYLFSASRPKKIIFDHLPKCGGSSLYFYLRGNYPMRKTFSIDGFNSSESVHQFKKLPASRRHGYDFISGHGAHDLLKFVHSECLRITLFRDPIDRFISHFYYAKRTPGHRDYAAIHEFELTLENYVESDISYFWRNCYTTHFSGLSVEDTEKHPEESVTRAVNAVLKQYDIIGFLDQFSSFSDKVYEQANLRHVYQNKKINVTLDRPRIQTIDPKTIGNIRNLNQLDIIMYQKLRDEID